MADGAHRRFREVAGEPARRVRQAARRCPGPRWPCPPLWFRRLAGHVPRPAGLAAGQPVPGARDEPQGVARHGRGRSDPWGASSARRPADLVSTDAGRTDGGFHAARNLASQRPFRRAGMSGLHTPRFDLLGRYRIMSRRPALQHSQGPVPVTVAHRRSGEVRPAQPRGQRKGRHRR